VPIGAKFDIRAREPQTTSASRLEAL